MPVTDQTTVNSSVGNGVTTVFAYAFLILDEDDLLVEVDGVEQASGYTVSGVGVAGGGNITFSVAPTNGAVVVRSRDMAFSRDTDYQESGAFESVTVDEDQDRQTMLAQQVREMARRAPKLPRGNSVAGDAFELPAPSAGGFWRWNADGDAIEYVDFDPESEADMFLQSGTGAVARTWTGKVAEIVSVQDFGTGTTNALTQIASDSFDSSKGVILIPASRAADAAAPSLPETTTVLDFRGDANPPNETTPSYSGVHIDFNSRSMGSISAFAVWQKRTSPDITSSAGLFTSFFSGTLPDANTLAGLTAQASTTGAVTPGTGVLTAIEAYTSVQSTGGTIADVRGLTASVNLDRAASTTDITTASAIFAGSATDASAASTIDNAYGLYAAAQTVGTARNYAIYDEGCLLQNHQQRWDALDKDGNIKKIFRFGTGASNNNLLLSGLTDALGWKWTDQAGSALYTHLTSVGIGYGIDPRYTLDLLKTVAGDIIGKIANPSATGYGLKISAGGANYALAICDYSDGAINAFIGGDGVIAINNTYTAGADTASNGFVTVSIGGVSRKLMTTA